jgi:murein L,D-transpeptidase YcbB/YkuD
MVKILLWIIIIFTFINCSSTHKAFIVSDTKHSFSADSSFLIKKNETKLSISSIINNNASKYKTINDLYKKNNYSPIWFNLILRNEGLKLLESANKQGLSPNDYSIKTLKHLIDNINNSTVFDAKKNAMLDVMLTKNIILYSNHLLFGKINPKNIYPSWNYSNKVSYSIDSLILDKIDSDSILYLDKILEPKSNLYKHLKSNLQKYRNIKNSLSENTYSYPNTTINIGDSSNQIFALKKYLCKLGYLSDKNINYTFDSDLKKAIMQFQSSHGLAPDGILGKNTYYALQWSPQKYIDEIRINMERCRWMPKKYPDTLLLVNIPEYKTTLYKNNEILFSSRVIVGKVKNKTPVFCSKIDRVVFNPCWTVPNSIATKKLLPRIKRDSTYLDKHNMFIRKNGVDQVVDSIDFSKYSTNNFPFKIYQRSCSTNALGRVKFVFSNKYQIYMHDTSNKRLFNKTNRAFSSGCIRLENPLNLAKIILKDIDNNSNNIKRYLSKPYPIAVKLKNQVPIFITYFTCTLSNNNLVFLNDIYSYDYKILKSIGVK